MESTRRPFDRSLSKEPGLKKARLTEDPAAPDRSFNGRGRTSLGAGFIQRPVSSFSGGGGDSRFHRDRDSESNDSARGPYQHQRSPQLQQELVTQYETALAELTFNSKPIITNLTIIAGENVHAAKAIANTVCANVLEVPCEQKLPSLYLLDSIVKNIGKDYIKHFASRLPEVFCKAYRQVAPSLHPGMRHLFGTWKGVFPPQPLQIIEKELGIATTVNGSSSGTSSSRPYSQAQRPGHSIHVNPKYLEARQRLEQSSSVRGAPVDISKTLMDLPDDVEGPERTSVNSGRTWTDPYVKNIQRPRKDQVNEPACSKKISVTYGDSDYGSDSLKHSGLGIGIASEKLKHGKPLYESGRDLTGKIFDQQNGYDMKHGFRSYPAHKSTDPDSHLELKQNFGNRSSGGVSRSWKNSDEEEYMWDDINSRPTDSGAADISDKDLWIPDEFERPNIQRPRKDQVNEPACSKKISVTYGDSDYGSDSLKHSGLGIGIASEKLKHGKPLYESGRDLTGKIFDQQNGYDMKHGFRSYPAHKSTDPDSHLELKQNFGNRSSGGVSRSWKNSDEEEYMWDDINSRPTDSGAADISDKDLWIPDEFERPDFENHSQRPQSVDFIGSRVDDEASTDSLTKNPGQVVRGIRMSSSLTQEIHPLVRRLSGPVRNVSGDGYHASFSSSAKSLDRTSFQSQMRSGLSDAPNSSFSTNAMLGSIPSITQQTLGTGLQSPMHQRPPSPSRSTCTPNQVQHNNADQGQNSTPRLVDPRRPQLSGQRNIGPHNQFSQDSVAMPPQDVHLASSHRLQHQSLQTLSTIMPPQLRNHVPSSQQKKLEPSSGGAQKRLLPQTAGIGNCSTTGKLPNPLSSDSPEQSNTSTLLAAVVKSEKISSVRNLHKSSFQGAEDVSAQVVAKPPLPSGPLPNLTSLPSLHGNTFVPALSHGKVQGQPLPSGTPASSLAGSSSEEKQSAVNPASNPVSSLLSSLVARGLISASKKDSLSSASSSIPTQPPDLDTGAISSSTTADSSVAVSIDKPLPSSTDELSSHGSDAKIFDGLPQSMTTEIKNLIGFEFRPDVVRESHPAVVIELFDDLPHQCSVCGLRLKLQEQFDRHMEWHALRAPGQDSSSKTSRKWYSSSVDWVAGIAPLQPIDGASDLLGSENSELFVPADESQCACILCGELFEDFYCQERGEWMYKGAVYSTNPSSQGGTGNAHDSADVGLIVHANCAADVSFCDSGLLGDIKLEKDE